MKTHTKFKQTEIGMIPEGWEVKKVEELGKIITGKTPKTADKDNFGKDYPFITPRDMSGQKNIKDTERYLSKRGKDSVKNCLLPAKSIAVSCIGSDMGKVVMTTGESVTNQQINSVIPHSISADFIYYSLLNISDLMKNLGKQSTAVPIMNKSQFSKLKIAVPNDLLEAECSAEILSCLDSKIELNQQMNKTLEKICQALFKHWFINFEFPNEKGKPYKSSGGEMVGSDLGEIPKGWNVRKIAGVLDLAYGKGLKETERYAGSIPVYGSNGRVGWHNEPLVKGPGIVVGRKGNPGTVIWAQDSFYPIDTTFYVVPKSSVRSMYYLFYALKIQDLPSLSADSAVPGLNRSIAYMNDIIVPPPKILETFDGQVRTLFEKIQANESESALLGSIRDSLLPKLMSGQIRVPAG